MPADARNKIGENLQNSFVLVLVRSSHLHLVPSPTYRFTSFCIHPVRKYRARMDIHVKAPTHPIFPNRAIYVQNSTFTRTGGNLASKILVCCPPKIETGTSDRAVPDAEGDQLRFQLPSQSKQPEIRAQTQLIREVDFKVFRGFNQPLVSTRFI